MNKLLKVECGVVDIFSGSVGWFERPNVVKIFNDTQDNRVSIINDYLQIEDLSYSDRFISFINGSIDYFSFTTDNRSYYIKITSFDDALLELSNNHENEMAELRDLMKSK